MTGKDITRFIDSNIALNTEYTYRVFSYNDRGNSLTYSNELTIRTGNLPDISTLPVFDTSALFARSGGNIASDGGSPILQRGLVWGVAPSPTLTGSSKTSDSVGVGTFTSTIGGLSPNTLYYVRAYATTIYGTKYGNEISFRTRNQNQGPWVRLADALNATSEDEEGAWCKLSSDGNTLVTAWATFGSVTDNTIIRVYSFKNGKWEKMGADFSGTNITGVSMSGNGQRICIGYDMQPTRRRVFQWNGSSWVQLGGNIDGKSGEKFPISIEMSSNGNSFVEAHDNPSASSELARVYTYDGNAWIQKGRDFLSTEFYEYFASSTAISDDGNMVALGSPDGYLNANTKTGRVDVYRWNGSQWSILGNRLYGSKSGEDFGGNIALSGNGTAILISGRNDVNNQGFVHYYRYNGSLWQKLGPTLSGMSGDEFGAGLSISTNGNTFAIGAPSSFPQKGLVKVWEVQGSTFVQKGNDFIGTSSGANLGTFVSLSGDGNRLALGEPYSQPSNPIPPNKRNVRVFQW